MSLAAAFTAPNLPRGGSVRQEATLITLLAAAVALYYYGQDTLLWAAGAAAALALIWWRLDLGLQAVLLAAPFFRFPQDLGPRAAEPTHRPNRRSGVQLGGDAALALRGRGGPSAGGGHRRKRLKPLPLASGCCGSPHSQW